VGAKYANGAGTRLNVALFEITTQNEIVTDFSAGGKTAFKNATQTQRHGLEFSGQHLWHKHWRSAFSITAMKAVYDPGFSSQGANNSTTVVNPGNRLPAVPDRLGYAAMHWSQGGWAVRTAPMGWQASVEWMGRSRLWANDVNTAAAPGYGQVNLKLRHRQMLAGGTVEPYLAIDNLNDKPAVGSVIVNQSASRFYEPTLPRTWTLGLQAKWAL